MSAFEQCKAYHQLEIVDDKSTTFRSEHKFLIQALFPSRFFERRYSWTGTSVQKDHVPDIVTTIDQWGMPEQRIHGDIIKEGNSRILLADLGRTINPKEEVEIHFKHKMKDLGGTFNKQLNVPPTSAIRDKLTLCVITPEWDEIKISYQEYTHDTKKVIQTLILEPKKIEKKLKFSMDIDDPSKLNMGHRLVWTR